MYSAAVFLCVVYRVTSGFTVMASHNLRKSARRCSGCTIRLLELCIAFGVQTENTHSQSGCGYDQIRLYELTLSCRSLQTVVSSSICKTPTPPWLTGLSALANTPKGGSLTRRRKGTVSLRRFEKEMAFVKVEQALIPHFSKLHGQPAALHTEVIRKLLP